MRVRVCVEDLTGLPTTGAVAAGSLHLQVEEEMREKGGKNSSRDEYAQEG